PTRGARPPPRALAYARQTAAAEIHPLSLHDALPICGGGRAAPVRADRGEPGRGQAGRPRVGGGGAARQAGVRVRRGGPRTGTPRSEEHTSELQSREKLVCRLLLEKKKTRETTRIRRK